MQLVQVVADIIADMEDDGLVTVDFAIPQEFASGLLSVRAQAAGLPELL